METTQEIKGKQVCLFYGKWKLKSNKQMTKVHHKDDLRDVALSYEMLALEAIFTKKIESICWNLENQFAGVSKF